MSDFKSGFIVGVFLSGAATLLVLAVLYAAAELAAWWRQR